MSWRREDPKGGGTAYGSHFYKLWHSCQRKWWLSMRAPHPDGGEGLRTEHTAGPLLLGSGVHEGLEAYYRSGYSDGQYNVDAAVRHLETKMGERRGEWRSDTDYQAELAQGRKLLYDYDAWWGPNGVQRDYPSMKIVVDEEGPIIEREYRIEVGSGLPPFTCRVDAVVEWQGYRWVLEHKTTAASAVHRIQNSMRTNIQGTGECYVLQQAIGGSIQGILLNVLVKNRSSRSKEPPFLRVPIARTRPQLEMFAAQLERTALTMDYLNDTYDELVEAGLDPWSAAQQVFVASGSANEQCMAYNRPCEFIELCAGVGHEDVLTAGFRASVRALDEPTHEES